MLRINRNPLRGSRIQRRPERRGERGVPRTVGIGLIEDQHERGNDFPPAENEGASAATEASSAESGQLAASSGKSTLRTRTPRCRPSPRGFSSPSKRGSTGRSRQPGGSTVVDVGRGSGHAIAPTRRCHRACFAKRFVTIRRPHGGFPSRPQIRGFPTTGVNRNAEWPPELCAASKAEGERATQTDCRAHGRFSTRK